MLQKIGYLLLLLGLALPAAAGKRPASVTGYVRDSSGVPQMGAVVEILGSARSAVRVFTDDRGFYSVSDLLPGVYDVRFSAPSFLPVVRERLGLRAGSSIIVNATLNTLFEAFQMAPVRGTGEEDDWKWTLRSAANRPVLRVLDDQVVLARKENDDRQLKGKLSFVAGSAGDGYGASDVSTGFSLERSVFSSGTLSFNGNLGYGNGAPATVLRAAYSHQLPNGSNPSIALTVRRFAAPADNLHPLQALALSASDSITLGDVVELNLGSELQTIEFMGRVNAFRPFGSADVHLSPDTVLEYRYATSVPNGRLSKGFDSAPADLSESNPRLSLARFSPALERAHHHEVSISRRSGSTKIQLAAFSDRVSNTALLGVGGDLSTEGGEILPEVNSGTFTYQGRRLETRGMRAVLQHNLTSDLTATLDYGYGGVLDLAVPQVSLQDVSRSLRTVSRHALSAKMSGTIPRAKTRWIASYRWTSGEALTPVDLFNASAGQADPYLNFFLRQPIPTLGFLPARMEALIEIRNLLAQGYVPVMGQDGQTLYLVQSARAVRGGVSFTF